MFAQVTAGKHTCWAESARYAGSQIVLLSLFGTSNVVRAVGAHLSKKNEYASIPGWSQWLRLGDQSYARCHQTLGNDLHHMVIIDRRATLTGSAWDPTLYMVAKSPGEAKANWLQRFAPRCPVPLRPEWAPTLWDKGVESGAIRELDGFGMLCYTLFTDEQRWLGLVGDAIRQGEIQ